MVFIFLCLVTNLLSVTAMILGAAGVITALTNMHIVASTFLLPLGVIIYTVRNSATHLLYAHFLIDASFEQVVGGLKATFLTDYACVPLENYLAMLNNEVLLTTNPRECRHTLIVMVLLCWLTIAVFNNDAIDGLGSFYNVLVEADKTANISGNYQGSILSFKSSGSIIFGLVHSFGDFALVIMDTSFWQKGFSADTAAAMPGYLLGGIAYFAVPWYVQRRSQSLPSPLYFYLLTMTVPRAVGTTTGLAAIALESNPIFPTYRKWPFHPATRLDLARLRQPQFRLPSRANRVRSPENDHL